MIAATDSYTLRVCSQGARLLRDDIAAIMKMPKERLRVLTEDVGGAFGLKTGAYPEYIALLVGREKARPAGALDVGPLRSVPQRQPGARHSIPRRELALDEKGRFLALRIRNTANLGAYIGSVGANDPDA